MESSEFLDGGRWWKQVESGWEINRDLDVWNIDGIKVALFSKNGDDGGSSTAFY